MQRPAYEPSQNERQSPGKPDPARPARRRVRGRAKDPADFLEIARVVRAGPEVEFTTAAAGMRHGKRESPLPCEIGKDF